MKPTACHAEELARLCHQFRRDVVETIHSIQTGHPGGSLSVCEILASIYFLHANVDVQNPNAPDRDRVVLCKGHAAPMLYRILAEKGFFSVSDMKTLRQLNSHLQGHPSPKGTPGVDMASGPLGIGLSAAVGIALAQRMNPDNQAVTYAILGDGELNEGTVWEAVMAAHKFKVDNLITIVDWNGVQLDGTAEAIMPMGDLAEKFSAFGWDVNVVDGHDIRAISEAITEAKNAKGKVSVILAKTVKGKGVSFMEGKNIWHGKPINDEEFALAMKELEGCL